MSADIIDFRSREPLKLVHGVPQPGGRPEITLVFNRRLTPAEHAFFMECAERTAVMMRGVDFK